jgi:hypothetical protein
VIFWLTFQNAVAIPFSIYLFLLLLLALFSNLPKQF